MINPTDANIMELLNTIKSDYFIVSGIVLGILGVIVKKTKNKWDDRALGKLRKMVGR